jgi:hypothetical protein
MLKIWDLNTTEAAKNIVIRTVKECIHLDKIKKEDIKN